ncbi:unnamed protein product [Durusdinium trenchii]|uniref:Uncharacterized protein n=1 Tax=Durusdinium trenchii TaxID=1381693 RepID=A0ABP0MK50_9DINO
MQPPAHGESSLLAAKRLHQEVPPHRWCVTLQEFQHFVRDVRVAWRAGLWGQVPSHSTISFQDDSSGPNVYQVNVDFVKPCTLRAGGMSYALMLHSGGLDCEVFVSHAWAEGIFELCICVKYGWVVGKQNLYCCLLANPQNLDIGEVLGNTPSASPFAAALNSASHIIVAPNRAVSVYSRLWCVYEAYLAAKQEKIFVMPAISNTSQCLSLHCQWLFLPVLCGILLGGLLSWLVSKYARPKQEVATGLAILVYLNLGNMLVHILWPRHCRKLRAMWWTDSFLLLTSFLIATMYILLVYVEEEAATGGAWVEFVISFFRKFFFVALALLCTSSVGQNIHSEIEQASLKKLEQWLDFKSVRFATCSNPSDAEHIWNEISDSVADVDAAISILIKAGAYTTGLRQQYDAGVDITSAGYADLFIRTLHCALLLLVAAVVCAERGFSWREAVDLAEWLWCLPALACLVLCCVTPCILVALSRKAPEHGIFAVQVLGTMGLLVILVPAAYLNDFTDLSITQHRQGENTWSPSPAAALFFITFPVVISCISLALVWLGPTWMSSRLMHIETMCKCRKQSSLSVEDSDDDFDSDPDESS